MTALDTTNTGGQPTMTMKKINMTTATSSKPRQGDTTKRRWVFVATLGAATVGVASMAWACTPKMGTAQITPSSVARGSIFKFNGQGLDPKTPYKLFFVDNHEFETLNRDCHSARSVFTTKFRTYSSSGSVVTKKGMKTDNYGELDSDFTVNGIQPYKAFLPDEYPPDSVAAGPHDYKLGYPEPGDLIPTGPSVICGQEVDATGKVVFDSATQHLPFTVT